MAPRSSSVSSQTQPAGVSCSPSASPQNSEELAYGGPYPSQLPVAFPAHSYKISAPPTIPYPGSLPVVTTVLNAEQQVTSPIQTTCPTVPFEHNVLNQTVYTHSQQQPHPQIIHAVPQVVPPVIPQQVLAYPQPVFAQPVQVPHLQPVQPVPMYQQPQAPQPAEDAQDDLNSFQCSTQMEVIWNGQFNKLFSQFLPDAWSLCPTVSGPDSQNQDQWYEFADSAKVRFSCQTCGKAWTSMKGQVVFWYRLDQQNRNGYVVFRLYGQTCGNCRSGDEHAMWYPEEVVKVVQNVFLKVGEAYYGMAPSEIQHVNRRRAGKPRSQHNRELCQACREGTCRK